MGLLVPASNPDYMSANLLLGGVVEAGASQASQQMGGSQDSIYDIDGAANDILQSDDWIIRWNSDRDSGLGDLHVRQEDPQPGIWNLRCSYVTCR